MRLTEAVHRVHETREGVRLRSAFLGLIDRGYTHAEVELIQAAWYDVNVQDPCCAVEAEQYYLERKQ